MLSVFDIFRVGLGPSSSHTVGPMRAACNFVQLLEQRHLLEKVTRVRILLKGSLAATGRGHKTDVACELGLMGLAPETTAPNVADESIAMVRKRLTLLLNGLYRIEFLPERDIDFAPHEVPQYHTNAVDFEAYDGDTLLYRRRFYSIGGGFVVMGKERLPEEPDVAVDVTSQTFTYPYPFSSANELLALTKETGLSIAQIMLANEEVRASREEIYEKLDRIWEIMRAALERGLEQRTPLPGPHQFERRAKRLKQELRKSSIQEDPLLVMDWVTAYAMAVSEENAAGGRVVTAPTNGAAGVIPGVLQYYCRHIPNATQQGVRDFLLTAGAIGMLYKENASISGAEVGCQGEVGVACSMAAAGLALVLGGTMAQVENAAEIAMEHNLGLTCDPVAGQVQIPCIERNAVAAVKAITATRMALRGDGSHYISLDQVIRTMYETGRDMKSQYKETSEGGLAVCFVEC